MTHVDVVGNTALSRESEKIEYFLTRGCGHIVDAKTNPQRTFIQALLDQFHDLANLVGCGTAINGVVARKEVSGIFHHRHLGRDVTDSCAKVD